ncbi:MAG: hypothetical protein WAN13_05935, partial [Candidatus Acidiferrales bacterium]
ALCRLPKARYEPTVSNDSPASYHYDELRIEYLLLSNESDSAKNRGFSGEFRNHRIGVARDTRSFVPPPNPYDILV